MKYFIIILLILVSGCSKNNCPCNVTVTNEKVVVIDSKLKMNVQGWYMYKVNRIEKGTVDYVYAKGFFERGDTIIHKFID